MFRVFAERPAARPECLRPAGFDRLVPANRQVHAGGGDTRVRLGRQPGNGIAHRQAGTREHFGCLRLQRNGVHGAAGRMRLEARYELVRLVRELGDEQKWTRRHRHAACAALGDGLIIPDAMGNTVCRRRQCTHR